MERGVGWVCIRDKFSACASKETIYKVMHDLCKCKIFFFQMAPKSPFSL